MTDIFRKRPILGNRILTPIRERPTFKRVMSLWEADRRCKYYPQMKQSMFTPPTGCKVVERNVNGTTKYWEMLCNCELDEDTPKEDLILLLKRFAVNWS